MKRYDVLIIGSGPAGMNAAIYSSRMNLSTAIIEKGAPGGKLVNISKIYNWIGIKETTGPNLAIEMNDHAISSGTDSIFGSVNKIDSENNFVSLEDGQKVGYKYLIIASGTSEVIPEKIDGIHKYNNKGVSYCAICDGPLFKNEVVAVIGGGNAAVEESLYLSNVAKEVHLFVRNNFSAEKKSINDLKNKTNVFIHMNHEIISISGQGNVEEISTTNGEFKVKAIFPYIGLKANTSFIKYLNIKTENGFIVVDDNMKTSIDNIYSIGDVNSKSIRQISTAVSDGTIAAKTIANII